MMTKRNEQTEEAVIREHFERITPAKADLWPGVRRGIAAAEKKPQRTRHRGLAAALVCGALVLVVLMGMASQRFFVFHSDGSRTELGKDGAYTDQNGTTYSYAGEPTDVDGVVFEYDWPDRQLPTDNPFSFFMTDYRDFSERVGENRLGIRLPKLSAIPAEYSQRPYFRAEYYLTQDDLEKGADPDSLPESVLAQIGRYQMYWFKENKELFSVSCMPIEDLESVTGMVFISDDSTVSYRPVEIEGFEKAFVVTYYNKVYEKYGTDLILCQSIEATELYDTAFEGVPGARETMTANYISYHIQTVGLSEREAINAVENAFS